MVSFRRFVARLFLLLAICFAMTPASFAPAQAHNTATGPKQDAQPPGIARSTPPEGTGPSGSTETIPIDAERIDEAGKELGKKIDAVSAGASDHPCLWGLLGFVSHLDLRRGTRGT